MARIGTGIRPELGRIDYTPFLQGSLAGSQAIGRGLAGLGEAFGGAIQDYYKKKEERDVLTATVEDQILRAASLEAEYNSNKEAFDNKSPLEGIDLKKYTNINDFSTGQLKAAANSLNTAITKAENIPERKIRLAQLQQLTLNNEALKQQLQNEKALTAAITGVPRTKTETEMVPQAVRSFVVPPTPDFNSFRYGQPGMQAVQQPVPEVASVPTAPVMPPPSLEGFVPPAQPAQVQQQPRYGIGAAGQAAGNTGASMMARIASANPMGINAAAIYELGSAASRIARGEPVMQLPNLSSFGRVGTMAANSPVSQAMGTAAISPIMRETIRAVSESGSQAAPPPVGNLARFGYADYMASQPSAAGNLARFGYPDYVSAQPQQAAQAQAQPAAEAVKPISQFISREPQARGKLPNGQEPIEEISKFIARDVGSTDKRVVDLFKDAYETKIKEVERKFERPLSGSERAQAVLEAYLSKQGTLSDKVITQIENITQDPVEVINVGNTKFVRVGRGKPFQQVKVTVPSASGQRYNDQTRYAELLTAVSKPGVSFNDFDEGVLDELKRLHVQYGAKNLVGSPESLQESVARLRTSDSPADQVNSPTSSTPVAVGSEAQKMNTPKEGDKRSVSGINYIYRNNGWVKL